MCFTKNLPVDQCGITGPVDARDVIGIEVEKTSERTGRVRLILHTEVLIGKEFPLNVAYTLKHDLESARFQIVYGS